MNTPFSPNHYRLFRVLLGWYLVAHFVYLWPYGAELFSSEGMVGEAALSPLFGIVPNVLALNDAPPMVSILLASAVCASVLLMIGKFDRLAAIWIWYVLACIFARNPLIANPALPYLGWMLWAHLLMPRVKALDLGDDDRQEAMRKKIFSAAWIVLALTYSYSGYTKLLSPSWVSGDTVNIVLNNPLARDHLLNAFVLSMPEAVLTLLTWFILYVELLFAPLALFKSLRPWLWTAMLFVQFGFLIFLDFADLTIPMLLFHLLTFDSRWLKAPTNQEHQNLVLHYDGECGFCHGLPRFMLEEDRQGRFCYSPQQSTYSAKQLAKSGLQLDGESIVLQEDDRTYIESDAVVRILHHLGGLWRLVGLVLQVVPRSLRDSGYRWIGRHRYRLGTRPESLCPVLPASHRHRFRVTY